jgi:FixJ family two-component response regulator
MLTITTVHGTHARPSTAAGDYPTIFIVHHDPCVREALESCLEAPGREVRTFGSGSEFLACRKAAVPGCLILDVDLPDVNGLDLQRRMAAARPDMPVLFITACRDVSTGVQAIKAGAIEFLITPVREDVLLAAVGGALERSGRALLREASLTRLRESYASLTPREREVMELVAGGLLNKQVGSELGISVITVKAHRGQVMRKMKADSLPALVHMATSLGVPSIPATAAASQLTM